MNREEIPGGSCIVQDVDISRSRCNICESLLGVKIGWFVLCFDASIL